MRFKSLKAILDKEFEVMNLDGVWREVLGEPEPNGLWLIAGEEKMGKSTLGLMMAEAFSRHYVVGYVMAEQGFDKDFQDMIMRLGIGIHKNLKFMEYIPLEDLDYLIKKKNQPDIVFIDNLTVYVDELKNGKLLRLIKDNPKKLIIILAHKENGQVKYATGKLARRLAKRIIDVEGNMATVEGRGEGGRIIINKNKAELYHGDLTLDNGQWKMEN